MTSIARRLEKHFAVVAAAAAGAAMLGGVKANAAVVSSGPVNLNIAATTNGLYLNVVTGAYNTTGGNGSTVPGWDVNPWSSTSLNFFSPSNPSGGAYVQAGTATANLAPGSVISAANTFGSGGASLAGSAPFVLNSSNNIVGFRFLNENTGQVHYGWMRISLGSSLTATRSVVEYAYEDQAGVAITVVPAPAALALLGVAGVVGGRRRRN